MPGRSKRRRIPKRIVVVFVAAILLNLAVAWTLAIVRPGNFADDSHSLLAEETNDLFHHPVVHRSPERHWIWYAHHADGDGRGFGWEYRRIAFEGADGLHPHRYVGDQTTPTLLRSMSLPPDAYHLDIRYLRAGWPLPALQGAAVVRYDTQVYDAPHSKFYTWSAVLLRVREMEPKTTPWRKNLTDLQAAYYDGSRKLLPYRPMWPGFVVNMVFYALVLGGLFFGPGAIKRARRRKRGLCPVCAYPLKTDSNICSECGNILTVVPAPG